MHIHTHTATHTTAFSVRSSREDYPNGRCVHITIQRQANPRTHYQCFIRTLSIHSTQEVLPGLFASIPFMETSWPNGRQCLGSRGGGVRAGCPVAHSASPLCLPSPFGPGVSGTIVRSIQGPDRRGRSCLILPCGDRDYQDPRRFRRLAPSPSSPCEEKFLGLLTTHLTHVRVRTIRGIATAVVCHPQSTIQALVSLPLVCQRSVHAELSEGRPSSLDLPSCYAYGNQTLQ